MARHEPQLGDVFAVHRGGAGAELLGRVVSTTAVVGPTHGCLLVYLCLPSTEHARPGRDDLLVPPILTTRGAWSRGYFVHLRSEPLLPGDYLERHVFRDAQGHFYDEEARPAAAPASGEPVGEWKLLEVEAIEEMVAAALTRLPPGRVAPVRVVAVSDGYALERRAPTVEEYVRLRREAGLSPKSVEAARIGLPNSWFAVTVRAGSEAVGMGRVLGDGGCFFEVVDMAVLPAHQRRGLGKRIMAAMVEHLRRHAPAGAHVMLLADGPAHLLYEQFGFRATAPASIGMELRL